MTTPEVDDEILIESPLSGAMSKFPTGCIYRATFIYNILDIVQCIKNHLCASVIERSRLQLAILQVAFLGHNLRNEVVNKRSKH